ncbi:MAG: hypothetical protein AB8B66_02680 [Rickettsiaceae bacterium]
MKIILVIVTLLLSGCALTPIPYAPPLEGPTATVNFQNNSHRDLEISFYKESDGCKGLQTTPVISPNTHATHVIYAGRPLTFEYYLLQFKQAGSFCFMNLRFVPETNHNYLFQTTDNPFSCKWIMSDITQSKKPKTIKLEALQRLHGGDGSFCRKDPE